MADDRADAELEDRLGALEQQLDELMAELQTRPNPPRGPFGLPRPPSPREVLRYTDQYAIPTAVTILQTQIQLLELLQQTIRLAERGDRAVSHAESTRAQAEVAAKETISRIEQAVRDLQDALTGEGLPADDQMNQLLQDIQRLNAELEESLETSTKADAAIADGHQVDVESELEAIKDEVNSDGSESDPDE